MKQLDPLSPVEIDESVPELMVTQRGAPEQGGPELHLEIGPLGARERTLGAGRGDAGLDAQIAGRIGTIKSDSATVV